MFIECVYPSDSLTIRCWDSRDRTINTKRTLSPGNFFLEKLSRFTHRCEIIRRDRIHGIRLKNSKTKTKKFKNKKRTPYTDRTTDSITTTSNTLQLRHCRAVVAWAPANLALASPTRAAAVTRCNMVRSCRVPPRREGRDSGGEK